MRNIFVSVFKSMKLKILEPQYFQKVFLEEKFFSFHCRIIYILFFPVNFFLEFFKKRYLLL
jgi:hypothetical protein